MNINNSKLISGIYNSHTSNLHLIKIFTNSIIIIYKIQKLTKVNKSLFFLCNDFNLNISCTNDNIILYLIYIYIYIY